jgi:hypothetical protein
MSQLRLDALVKANRTVTAATRDTRERNRERLEARIAASIAGVASSYVARDALAWVGRAATKGALRIVSSSAAKWTLLSVSLGLGTAWVGVREVHLHSSPEETLAAAASVVRPEGARAGPSAQDVPASSATAPSEARPQATAPPAAAHGGQPRLGRGAAGAVDDASAETRRLERELELLRSARSAVATGSPQRALRLLDRYGAEFPHGTLWPESMATRVLALCAAGQVAAAQEARSQLLAQQPGSPLGPSLPPACGRRP